MVRIQTSILCTQKYLTPELIRLQVKSLVEQIETRMMGERGLSNILESIDKEFSLSACK